MRAEGRRAERVAGAPRYAERGDGKSKRKSLEKDFGGADRKGRIFYFVYLGGFVVSPTL